MEKIITQLKLKRESLQREQAYSIIQFIQEILEMEAYIPTNKYDTEEHLKAMLGQQLQKAIALREIKFQEQSCQRFNVLFADINADFNTSIENFSISTQGDVFELPQFGLDKKALDNIRLAIGAVTGATTGAGFGAFIDALAGGSTLLLGSVIGGVVGTACGAAGAYFFNVGSFEFMTDKKKTRLSAKLKIDAEYFILIDKAVQYARLAMNRTHTNRQKQVLKHDGLSKSFTQENVTLLKDFALAIRKDKKESIHAQQEQLFHHLLQYLDDGKA